MSLLQRSIDVQTGDTAELERLLSVRNIDHISYVFSAGIDVFILYYRFGGTCGLTPPLAIDLSDISFKCEDSNPEF